MLQIKTIALISLFRDLLYQSISQTIPTKTPRIIRWAFPGVLWDMKDKSRNASKTIYLTFDDGPIPEVTEFVLELLDTYNAKATFFCIGDNIRKHPAIFDRIVSKGHAVGNHTMHHLKAWKNNHQEYIQNILDCQQFINTRTGSQQKTVLFRPPYGQVSPGKTRILRKMGYQIVMWDVLSKDWKQDISPEKCLQNVIRNTASGSIIVFHDSIKSVDTLYAVLPKVLKHFTEEGFSFDSITI